MTHTTTATRDKLEALHIPETMDGDLFEVRVTPITQEQASIIRFRNLKGIAGRKLDYDEIREERLREAAN